MGKSGQGSPDEEKDKQDLTKQRMKGKVIPEKEY